MRRKLKDAHPTAGLSLLLIVIYLLLIIFGVRIGPLPLLGVGLICAGQMFNPDLLWKIWRGLTSWL